MKNLIYQFLKFEDMFEQVNTDGSKSNKEIFDNIIINIDKIEINYEYIQLEYSIQEFKQRYFSKDFDLDSDPLVTDPFEMFGGIDVVTKYYKYIQKD